MKKPPTPRLAPTVAALTPATTATPGRLSLVATLWLALAALADPSRIAAQPPPVPIGAIYETPLGGVSFDADGTRHDSRVPARLTVVRSPARDTAPTLAHLAIERAQLDDLHLLEIAPDDLPEELADLFDEGGPLLLGLSHAHYRFPINSEHLVVDLIALVAEARASTTPPLQHIDVRDGTGRPAEGIRARAIAWFSIPGLERGREIAYAATTLGPDGVLTLRHPIEISGGARYANSDAVGPASYMGSFRTSLEFEVPATGITERFDAWYRMGKATRQRAIADPLQLGLLVPEREEGADVFAGQLVDLAGASVGPARLALDAFGSSTGGAHFGPGEFTTPPSGAFRLGVPKSKPSPTYGAKPPATRPPRPRTLAVRYPIEDGPRLSFSILPGPDSRNILSVGKGAPLTLRLLDERGQPWYPENYAARKKTRSLFLDARLLAAQTEDAGATSAKRSEKKTVFSGSLRETPEGTWQSTQAVPLPGDYRLVVNNRQFERLHLDLDDAATTISWRLRPERLILQGRVVDAPTGAPITGALLLVSEHDEPSYFLARLTPAAAADFGAVEARAGDLRQLAPGARAPRFMRDEFGVAPPLLVSRADAEGCIDLSIPAYLGPVSLTVWAPGTIPVTTGSQQLDRFGLLLYDEPIPLPDAVLAPAASVICHVAPPDPLPTSDLKPKPPPPDSPDVFILSLEASGSFAVHFEPPAGWAAPIETHNRRRDYDEGLLRWNRPAMVYGTNLDVPVRLAVPAGIPFEVGLEPHTRVLKPFAWSDLGPLAVGEELHLPTRAPELNIPVRIRLLTADGAPAANLGVSVGERFMASTDAAGEAIVWAPEPGQIELRLGGPWAEDPLGVLQVVVPPDTSVEAPALIELTLPEGLK